MKIEEFELNILDDLTDQIYAQREKESENWDSWGISVSEAGSECFRALWYKFRWTLPTPTFPGRTLRIFESGNIQEERIIEDLRRAGLEVWDVDSNGRQFSARLVGGMVRGKLDAAVRGLTQFPGMTLGCEAKSHNKKNFRKLQREGVRKAFYKHWVQLQLYLHHFGFTHGLYAAVNKDDEYLRFEVVEYDESACNVLLGRLETTVQSNFAPPRLSDDPEYWLCKICDYHGLCHGDDMPTRRTCRSCIHSSPVLGNKYPTFQCDLHGFPTTPEEQKLGCESHLFYPELIPGEQVDADEESMTITYKLRATGETWVDRGQAVA